MKHFTMTHNFLSREVKHFTEETVPDWLSSEKIIPGSTYDNRWFWERVLNLDVGQNIKTDFQTITRIK